jgi:hypothetical protein
MLYHTGHEEDPDAPRRCGRLRIGNVSKAKYGETRDKVNERGGQ